MAAGIPFVSTNCGDVTDRAEFGKVYNDPHNLADGIEFFLHYHEYRNERVNVRIKPGKQVMHGTKPRLTTKQCTKLSSHEAPLHTFRIDSHSRFGTILSTGDVAQW